MGNDVNNINDNSSKVWAYVHGELDDRECVEFERLMNADAHLAKRARALKRVDHELTRLLPLSEQPAELLEEQILEEWERTRLEENIRKPILAFPWRPSGAWNGLILAAALLIIGVGIHWQTRIPLQWAAQKDAYAFRGEKVSIYSEQELTGIRESMKETLLEEYKLHKPRSILFPSPRSPWVWSVEVSPTVDNQLLLDIALYDQVGEPPVKSWQNVFSNKNELINQMPLHASTIIGESFEMKK